MRDNDLSLGLSNKRNGRASSRLFVPREYNVLYIKWAS